MSLSVVQAHFADIPAVDATQVGEHVGTGAQSMVWAYGAAPGNRRVIKAPLYQVSNGLFSQTVGRLIGQTLDTARRELEMCHAYFEPYMVPTEVHANAQGTKFCILQDMVQMDDLTPEICASRQRVREQLEDVMERNRKMIIERRTWFDAMGFHIPKLVQFVIAGRPYLQNIALDTPQDAIRLFDYGLFPMPEQTTFRLYYRALLAIQQRNMQLYGMEFGG